MIAKKIVVVEDNKDVRENLAEILELDGYEVATAENGKVGVKVIEETMPDLIICDIMMPELDGYETAKQIRELDNKSETKIVFLTAKGTIFDKMKAYENGGDDFIVKPCSNEKILEKVEL